MDEIEEMGGWMDGNKWMRLKRWVDGWMNISVRLQLQRCIILSFASYNPLQIIP
jgi:hypothetical protein